MRGLGKTVPLRSHVMITKETRSKSLKYRVADESKERNTRLPKNMSQPTEHPPQVSITHMRLSFDETTLHMKFDERRDAANDGRPIRPTSTYF